MHTEDLSDGPAVTCPGQPPTEQCRDYPDGACQKCVERAQDGERDMLKLQREYNVSRNVNTALILGAGPRPKQPPKPNPYPNGPR